MFLDRDGVLNRAVMRNGRPYPPKTVEDVEIMPGAPRALRRMKDAGFVLIVVTNQPDVARGKTTLNEVEAINRSLAAAMPIDSFEMCVHDDWDNCECRKPKPGMLTRSGARHGIDLKVSAMIGDRWRDIDAGRAAGCRTILLGDGYGEKPMLRPDTSVQTIEEAAEWILANT